MVWRFHVRLAVMLDHSSKLGSLPSSDLLTDMLKSLRLDGVEYGRCKLAAPWAYSFPAEQDARFHFVSGKGCWLFTPSGEWIELSAGDAVLLPRGSAHSLASEPDAIARPFPRWQCKTICGILELQCPGENSTDGFGKGPGDNRDCLLFYGSMRFNLDSMHPLLRMMPDVMRTNELRRGEPAIPHLLEAMGCEVAMNRVGASGIVTRLADVLAAQIIRSWVEHGCEDAAGWIAAVRNPEIGRVLAAIHADPDREWLVLDLAQTMGASRSSFASKFAALVGETPARYVAQVRMHQARQWIMRDRARISDVAHKLGYDSDASFSRAFKRIIGQAPSHFRTRAGREQS